MTPQQEKKLDDVLLLCERLDERTERQDDENERRFASAHKRIDEVREEAKAAGRKSGGGAGAIVGGLITIAWSALSHALGFGA